MDRIIKSAKLDAVQAGQAGVTFATFPVVAVALLGQGQDAT